MAAQPVIRAYSFIDTIGVNTHIDFARYGYQNLAVVEAAINYLGLKNLRDSAQTATDAQTWLHVAQATGAKFDNYIAETSPSGMSYDLSFAKQLAQEGLLNYLEGGNEEDDAYPAALGNTLAITAQFQQQVYAVGHALGLPVINMSFGAGWTAANNWQGHYGDVGDLGDYADYANAHTYPLVGQGTDWTTQRLNGLALLAAASRPVITTEIGWNESQGFGQDNIAKRAIQAVLDGMKNGNVKTYFYALYDDGSGLFGLMRQDGTAKPAGTAIHNLTTLLADKGATASTFATGSLNYTLGGTTASDNSLLMQKSDGSFWLSLWNENDAAHNVTITLPQAAEIKAFNPLTGLSALQDVKGATTATFSVTDRPLLVEILGAAPAQGVRLTGTAANDTLTGGTGKDALNGGVGADSMAGGTGNDTYFVDNPGDVVKEAAGGGADTVFASVNYSLSAGSEIEFLRANAGSAGLSLTGNAFNNKIIGGAGNDTICGGGGGDTLTGGLGSDVFKFMAGFGQDTITDFTASGGAHDLLDLSGLGIKAATFAASVTITAGAAGSTMVGVGSDSIRLLQVAPANIDTTDFRFA